MKSNGDFLDFQSPTNFHWKYSNFVRTDDQNRFSILDLLFKASYKIQRDYLSDLSDALGGRRFR